MNAKTCVAAITFLMASAAQGFAADLPAYKAPPPAYAPPPPLWTGFYVGLNAGGTWAASNGSNFGAAGLIDDPLWLPAGPFAASASGVIAGTQSGGFIGGGQIGYNYQFGPSLLVGFETDIQGVAGSSGAAQAFGAVFNPLTGSTASTITTVSRSLDWIGTVRGRLGWLFTPTLLLYGTGGFAYGGTSLSVSQVSQDSAGFYGPGFGAVNVNPTATGWTAGGGLEWMFMPSWSAKVEYLYYDLGTQRAQLAVTGADFTVPGNGTGIGFFNVTDLSTRFNGHIVRAGVNYHFNWGAAPAVARY